MEHDINLNIHYSAPDDIWEKIGDARENEKGDDGYFINGNF